MNRRSVIFLYMQSLLHFSMCDFHWILLIRLLLPISLHKKSPNIHDKLSCFHIVPYPQAKSDFVYVRNNLYLDLSVKTIHANQSEKTILLGKKYKFSYLVFTMTQMVTLLINLEKLLSNKKVSMKNLHIYL